MYLGPWSLKPDFLWEENQIEKKKYFSPTKVLLFLKAAFSRLLKDDLSMINGNSLGFASQVIFLSTFPRRDNDKFLSDRHNSTNIKTAAAFQFQYSFFPPVTKN